MMSLLRWFAAHRTEPPRAIVLGIDDAWCQADRRFMEGSAFPGWLIAANDVHYLVSLFRYDSVEQAFQRLIKPEKNAARPPHPRGYWNLELDYTWTEGRVAAELAKPWVRLTSQSATYPSLNLLRETLDEVGVEASTRLFLVVPPVWRAKASDAVTDPACLGEIQAFAASRSNTIVVNGRDARASTMTPENFFDRTHYREPIARELEAEIQASMRPMANR